MTKSIDNSSPCLFMVNSPCAWCVSAFLIGTYSPVHKVGPSWGLLSYVIINSTPSYFQKCSDWVPNYMVPLHLGEKYYYLHFAGEYSQAQRGQATCLRSLRINIRTGIPLSASMPMPSLPPRSSLQPA